MDQHDRIRKLRYSSRRFAGSGAVMLVGIALVIGAIVLGFKRDWSEAIGPLVAAATLVPAGVTFFYSAKNQPETVLCRSQDKINAFMRYFISQGSTAHIASFGLSWVKGYPDMQDFLADAVKREELVILARGPNELTEVLKSAGIRIIIYPTSVVDVPRFTLLNLGRAGSERLAVAREGLPNHWIDVYEDKHHPQVIAIARAYIRRVEGTA